jgi:Icc protein
MSRKPTDELLHDHNHDGIDRRGFLKCMAWAGTGAFCIMQGGVLKAYSLGRMSELGTKAAAAGELCFAQISDSHMGFNKPANTDVAGTLKAAVGKINGLAKPPEFLLHTGDISHLSRPEEFDTVDQILKAANPKDVFFVPGEHDVLEDNGKSYLERYGKNAKGGGWYSFDKKGVHFVGLVNVLNLKAGGLGSLGSEQLEWMEDDVKHLKHSTPIVVFAHIPLWTVYPDWGWGTQDSEQALAYLKKFGSRDGAQRTHSPDDAEGGRKCDVPYSDVNRISATPAGQGRVPGADEGASGTAEESAGNYGCELCAGPSRLGDR